jgi:hypothetical protein
MVEVVVVGVIIVGIMEGGELVGCDKDWGLVRKLHSAQ